MRGFRYARPGALPALFVTVVLLSGCGALNPLQDLEPGPDRAWSQTASRSASPAPVVVPTRPARIRPTTEAPTVEVGSSVRVDAPVLAGAAALGQHLRAKSAPWIGTPYRYGGTTRRGIDCSAFVRALMQDATGQHLPRTTATQVQEGISVEKRSLLPGDLVFFRRRGTRHVGVYLGGGEFVHASSSKGVTYSNLSESYYQRHYWTARRVLNNPRGFLPTDTATETVAAETAANRRPDRAQARPNRTSIRTTTPSTGRSSW